MTKGDAVSINSDLSEKIGQLWQRKNYKLFCIFLILIIIQKLILTKKNLNNIMKITKKNCKK